MSAARDSNRSHRVVVAFQVLGAHANDSYDVKLTRGARANKLCIFTVFLLIFFCSPAPPTTGVTRQLIKRNLNNVRARIRGERETETMEFAGEKCAENQLN